MPIARRLASIATLDAIVPGMLAETIAVTPSAIMDGLIRAIIAGPRREDPRHGPSHHPRDHRWDHARHHPCDERRQHRRHPAGTMARP